MRNVLKAASDLQQFCVDRGWQFCSIGGIAVQRWGHPRFTDDADRTLLTGWWNEESFVDPLLVRFAPRRPDARAFALRHRVLLLRHENGIDLDVGLGAVPFEEASIARSSVWEVRRHRPLRTCSAEDLILKRESSFTKGNKGNEGTNSRRMEYSPEW